MEYVLKNGLVYANGLVKKDILVSNGLIKQIGDNLNALKEIDCSGLLIAPSFIEPHAHFREPGFEESETILTGSNAACRGGYTNVFIMPNTKPCLSSKENLDSLQEIIKRDSKIMITPIATITKDEMSEELISFSEVDTVGYSDDGKPVMSSRLMYEALLEAKKNNKVLLCHEEDLDLVNKGIFNDCSFTKEHNYKVNLDISESTMVARDLVLSHKTGGRLHICHMATKESLELVKFYKSRGCKVTCEVTPHHLVLNDTMLDDDPNYKMNPPIRGVIDQEAMIEGLINGDIDMISTDHAPHSIDKKNCSLDKSAFGIVGIETSFALVYTELVKTNKMSLERLLDCMSLNVANAFNIKTNEIVEKNECNLVIIDLEKEFIIDKDSFLSKGRNTPFDGKKCFGKIEKTIYKGEIVYEA